MEVGVGTGLELEEFFSEAGEVDFKRSGWRGAGGESVGKERVVILRGNIFFQTIWGSAYASWRWELRALPGKSRIRCGESTWVGG